MIVTPSALAYPQTVTRLLEAIERRKLTLFARIDHAAAARQVGLGLADEEVFVFGNPRAGTSLMQSDPRIGIELPLRMLVWGDSDGVALGYLDPRELAGRYNVAAGARTLEAMSQLLSGLARDAAGQEARA